MDQHGEKEGENKSQDSTAVAAEEEEHTSEESMDQGEGYKAEESAGLLIKEVSSEEASPPSPSPSPALFAHPCSLLQLLLRACAGCLGLHGYCSGADPKPAAVAPPPPEEAAVAAAADLSEGGEKANDFYMQGEVLTRVWAVRRPRPPSERPREGSGAKWRTTPLGHPLHREEAGEQTVKPQPVCILVVESVRGRLLPCT